jgi:hypothetical protein
VSDHPHWLMQALAGIVLALLTFGGVASAGNGKKSIALLWPRIAALAFVSAVMFGWTIELVPIESYSVGGWLRSIALAAVAAAAPIVCAAACAAGRPLPVFAALLGRSEKPRDTLGIALGVVLIVLTVLAVQEALGLVFDPRYRDFAFAPLSAAVVPFLVLMASTTRAAGSRAIAETVAGAILVAAAVYIVPDEGLANWQSNWFCAAIFGLAVILLRARDAPDSE